MNSRRPASLPPCLARTATHSPQPDFRANRRLIVALHAPTRHSKRRCWVRSHLRVCLESGDHARHGFGSKRLLASPIRAVLDGEPQPG